MSVRKIHQDKQGLYIMDGRRKFRPAGPTAATVGEQVQMKWQTRQVRQSNPDMRSIYAWQRDSAGLILRDPTTRRSLTRFEEDWHSNDVPPQIRERLTEGQMNIVITANGQQATIVVGSDGMNYRDYRKEPKRGQKPTKGTNVFISNKLLFTWAEWDEVVARVAEARDTVEIGPITVALEEELAAHDEMQQYLKEKGLVESTPEWALQEEDEANRG